MQIIITMVNRGRNSAAATNRVVIRVNSSFRKETGRPRELPLGTLHWKKYKKHDSTRFKTIISQLFLLDYRAYTFFAES